MRQYEIWWAKLPKPAGDRPVLLLSRDAAYSYLTRFIAAEITTTLRGIPTEVELGPAEGLPRQCVANLDAIFSVSRKWLEHRVGYVSKERQWEVKRAAGRAFNWPQLDATAPR